MNAVTDDSAQYDDGRIGLTAAAANLTEQQNDALRQLSENHERAFCLVSGALKWIGGLANPMHAQDVPLAGILIMAYNLLADMGPLHQVVLDAPRMQS